MNKTNFLNILSACAMMIASMPAFAYVYLLFNRDYYVYDFVLDDDTAIFCAIFVGLSFVSRILAFWGKKDLICDFSIAMFLLVLGWMLVISGLGGARLYRQFLQYGVWRYGGQPDRECQTKGP